MEGGWTNKTLSHTHCLSNLRTDHGTGRYGLAKYSDYASCAEMRKIRKTGFYMNFIDKIHNSFTSHDTPITQDTSSRLTLSLNQNTPSPDAITPRMPFITIRPNHHVKDIVGCARLPRSHLQLWSVALDSPTERRGGVCPLSLLSAGGIFQLAAGGLRAPKPAQAARRARNRQRVGQGERGASQPCPCRGVRRGTGLQRRQGDLP